MKKLLLCLTLCVLLLCGTAFAAPVTGGFIVSGGTEGTDYVWNGDELTVLTETPLTIRNLYAAEAVSQYISIAKNVSANVTLSGVNIAVTGQTPAVNINGVRGSVTITLQGENHLVGGSGHPAIEKAGTAGKLVICGDGSLSARGGAQSPAIGSRQADTYIEISGGVITAEAGSGARAGIGSDFGFKADVRISPEASVKGECSMRPTGLQRENLGLYVLDNPRGETVAVDGTVLPNRTHMDEDRLYLWLPVGERSVAVGSDTDTVDVDAGYDLRVTGGVEGTDYLYFCDDLRILTAVPLTVSNVDPGTPTRDMIYIAADVDADVTLAGVNIDSCGGLRIADNSRGSVNIRLAENTVNTLRASSGAGLQKNGANGSLTISGTGRLDAYGGGSSAGIGGGVTYWDEGAARGTANITIAGGVITARGGVKGAGIGSGLTGTAENITISGGTVTAFGADDSAAIGSGDEGALIGLYITGGTVTASTDSNSAAIGGGERSSVRGLYISGGTVNASASYTTAIGAGDNGTIDLIRITGGTVTAATWGSGAAIGSNRNGSAGTIEISGGTVRASGVLDGAAIGAGYNGSVDRILITGGDITVSGYDNRGIAIGAANGDYDLISIDGCVLTVNGEIGATRNQPPAAVIGESATVKANAILPSAVNASGEPVYMLLIENVLGEPISVAGKAFPHVSHGSEKAVYVYRPAGDTAVKVGAETQTVPFDANANCFARVHAPAAERTGVIAVNCTRNGYTGDLYCMGCGELLSRGTEIPAPGHDCTMTVVREATLSRPGEVHNHCTVCGADYSTEERCIGDFIVSGIESDGDVSFSGGVLTVQKNRTLMIRNLRPAEPTTARIAVADGTAARVILGGVYIDVRSVENAAAFSVADGSSADVRLELAEGTNNLLYSGSGCAGVQKNGGSSSGTLTVTGTGLLIASGGSGAAGIGSGSGHALYNVSIEGGHIGALGGKYGAGIGSGNLFSAVNLRITGGTVTAIGGQRARGIGHGYNVFGITDTESLVIGPMASVKANGPAGALGTRPVNEDGQPVFLSRYTIPENGYLTLGRTTRFPYVTHDGEPLVYVYLASGQTAEPHAEGSSQLLTGGFCAVPVLMTPPVQEDETARADFSGTDVAGLEETAKQYEFDSGTVIITLAVEPKDEQNAEHAEALRAAASRSETEFFALTLSRQINAETPTVLEESGSTPLVITVPFDFSGVDAASVAVLRYHGGVEALPRDPAAGSEGYSVDAAAGTVTILANRFSTYAICYDAELPLCTLTFDTDGGSAIGSITGTVGDAVALSRYVPTKAGCIFGGWFSDPALTVPVEALTLSGDRTVYAKWTKAAASALPFTDVGAADWYRDDVAFVYEKSLMDGVSETEFAPLTDTSRAMLVTILWRLEGEPVVNCAMRFADVEPLQWYTEAIRWANAVGIVEGYSDECFGPADPVTREQTAAILFRYAALKGLDVRAAADLSQFADCASVDVWAAESVGWANAVGLIDGVSDTLLDPLGTAKRAQLAAILHRFCGTFAL